MLRSAYPQSHVELICVDNGSTDDTLATLERYGSKVKVVIEHVRGPSAARNAGIRAATGEIVAFTDSDCVVSPEWLGAIVEPLADPSVGAVAGRILAHRPCSAVAVFGEVIHDHRRAVQEFKPPYFITMNVACRRSDLTSLGMFDERLLRGEDVDLAYRMLQAGMNFAYRRDAVIYHRNRDTIVALAREGFQHGYYSIQVHKLHREFLSSYQPDSTPPVEVEQAELEHPAFELSPRRTELYWAAFRFAKKVGKALARRRAEQLLTTCTTADA